jgi:hypothetical protein
MITTPTLLAQQRALQRAICDLDEAPALLQPADAALAVAAAGLAAYQDAYRARLIAALRDNFSVLHRAMGDADFEALALAYLAAQPSQQASIRWFGDGLAEFMAEAYLERLAHPSLVDFARMDWALRAAFDGPTAATLSAADLLAVAPEAWGSMVFKLHPTVRLLHLEWAIEPAWRALSAFDPSADEAADEPETEAPEALSHPLLIWREGFETRWRSLQPLETELLQASAEGQSFAALCELAARSQVDAPGAVVQWLQCSLSEGLLAA